MDLLVPTEAGAEMLSAGTSKFEWLNRFVKLICTRKNTRSRMGTDLNRAALAVWRPGPTMIPRPELPNRPALAGGTANADASNQRSIVRRSLGRFPFEIRSGIPPTVWVFEGSDPEKDGVRYSPVCAIYDPLNCQPPRIPAASPPL